jgi:hypothetical protein
LIVTLQQPVSSQSASRGNSFTSARARATLAGGLQGRGLVEAKKQ